MQNFTVSGLKLFNVIDLTFTETEFNTSVAEATPVIDISGMVRQHEYNRIIANVPVGSPIFRIDPAIPDWATTVYG